MNYKNDITWMKSRILEASFSSREGHIPSAFSILDIIWILHTRILRLYLSSGQKEQNKFVLSKGHGCLALYATLERLELLPSGTLQTFCKFDSIIGGHPDSNKVPGVLASTGSLGHGLPFAVGLALANKIRGINSKIYCLVGDGECNEGSIWESALLAAHSKLDNLVCIVDDNDSSTRALNLGSIKNKFQAFGWVVFEIDGHNHEQIEDALKSGKEGQPSAIVAKTIKGFGVKRMEQNPAWHHKSPNAEELSEMLVELEGKCESSL
jgi:transketolase